MIRALPSDATPIARAVKARMDALGLGQKRLAEKAGVNETYVRDILKGKSKNPKHDHLVKLADALGCSLGELTDAPEQIHSLPLVVSQPKGDSETVYKPEDIAFVRLWKLLGRADKAALLIDAIARVPKQRPKRG